MSQLNVLLITYAFPPAGGVGTLRAASLARYFPEFDIRFDVLTTRNPSSVGNDDSHLRDIPASVTIHRTMTLDLPFGVKKWLKRVLSRRDDAAKPTVAATTAPGKPSFLKRTLQDLLLPDPQVTWLPILTRASRRIVRERKIDLVLITAAPYSNVLVAERLRKQFPNLPIVLDFRDEWLATAFDVAAFSFSSSSEKAKAFARNAEANSVKSATAVVSVTEAANCEIRARYPQQPESKFLYIPNGFDATRLRRSSEPATPRSDGKIVVTYVGSIYASTEPTRLVEALQSLPPEIKNRFLFRFIGQVEDAYRNILLSLGDMVELRGFLPQHEALAAMNETGLRPAHLHMTASTSRPSSTTTSAPANRSSRASIRPAISASASRSFAPAGGQIAQPLTACANSSSTQQPVARHSETPSTPTRQRSQPTNASPSPKTTPHCSTP